MRKIQVPDGVTANFFICHFFQNFHGKDKGNRRIARRTILRRVSEALLDGKDSVVIDGTYEFLFGDNQPHIPDDDDIRVDGTGRMYVNGECVNGAAIAWREHQEHRAKFKPFAERWRELIETHNTWDSKCLLMQDSISDETGEPIPEAEYKWLDVVGYAAYNADQDWCSRVCSTYQDALDIAEEQCAATDTRHGLNDRTDRDGHMRGSYRLRTSVGVVGPDGTVHKFSTGAYPVVALNRHGYRIVVPTAEHAVS